MEGDARLVGRRWVLRNSARGVVSFAVLGLAACADGDGGSSAASGPASTVESDGSDGLSGSDGPDGTPSLTWRQVDLGFVAAFVLVRGAHAAVVDTGTSGSEQAIGAVLDEAGAGWSGVRHVVLTHRHPDHVGSVSAVLDLAPQATGYLGQADLEAVSTAKRLTALRDGDEVFGLQAIATPGHTAGHMAVFDPTTRVLVAGDALRNSGGLQGSDPRYTDDPGAAAASVRALAALSPAALLVGHGDPIVDGAAAALSGLADSLG
jgi:glyoxylase-like metal-dependent hydrolase (beta-lactamase superfamily II)